MHTKMKDVLASCYIQNRDLISLLMIHLIILQDLSPENKLRLLMIYAAVYPEKFEGDKGIKLMQVC